MASDVRASASVLAVLSLFLCGCPPDLGPCDPEAARRVVFTADDSRLPAYGGQALVESSCGGGAFCHAELAEGPARYGVPAGLDFDVSLAENADQTARLRRGIETLRAWRLEAYREVHAGTMPPGAIGSAIASTGIAYADLPPVGTAEGDEILRNWLACGAPVVERTTPRPDGFEPVGDIVPAGRCSGTACGDACVDIGSDPANCGGCGNTCAPGTVCATGACIEGGCPAPTVDCSGACVETGTSEAHCGACDNACTAGMQCSAGTCATSACAPGLTMCGAACVDTSSDSAHCGACDAPCAASETCSGGACASCDPSVTLSGHVQPIFTARCASSTCHGGARPQAGLSLESGRSHAALVGVPSRCMDGKSLVAAGDIAGSYVINKVTGIGICTGMRMPLRDEPLSTTEIDLLRNWICNGALND